MKVQMFLLILEFILYTFGFMRSNYVYCILDIAEKCFPYGSPVLVSIEATNINTPSFNQHFTNYTSVNTIFNSLHSSEKWTILAYDKQKQFNTRYIERLDYYVLVSEGDKSVTSLNRTLGSLSKNAVWSTTAKFIVTVNRIAYEVFRKMLTNVVSVLQYWKILNVVILSEHCISANIGVNTNEELNRSYFEMYTIYTWVPNPNPNYLCKENGRLILLDTWLGNNEIRKFTRNFSLFPNKILQRCGLEVSTFHYEPLVYRMNAIPDDGLEIKLFNAILQATKLTAVYLPPPPGEEKWGGLVNKTWNGLIGQLINKRSDVVFAGLVNVLQSFNIMDFTYQYLFSQNRWMVPCPKPVTRLYGFAIVFSLRLWICHTFVHITTAYCICLLEFRNKNEGIKSWFICSLELYCVFFGGSVLKTIPRRNSVRIAFISWVIYSMIMATVYQTYLTYFLINPGSQISSENELLRSGMKILLNPVSEKVHLDLQTDKYKRREHCVDLTKCLKRIIIERNLAMLCADQICDYIGITDNYDSNGDRGFCGLKERFSVIWVGMIIQKGDPMISMFNNVILRVMQADLIGHWWEYIKHRKNLEFITNMKYVDYAHKNYLDTNSQLTRKAAYFIILLGYISSVVAFTVEQIVRLRGRIKTFNY
ncbi:Ionotropic receptor 578 [Blattella germanica]|nr:Ionotropic receptor 578 [Blattella germanica]